MSSDVLTAGDAAEIVPLSVPSFQGNEWRYLKECLDGGWVSSAGPFVERFERLVAQAVGAPQAVAVVNGTAGLHIALTLVGVEPGDEVLVSDLTFIAPVNAIHYCGAEPVFVDADPGTWQMDVAKLANFLSRQCEVRSRTCYDTRTGRRVRAVVPVHVLGLACAIDRIVALATEYHLAVVEDAAEGIGVRYAGRHVGTFGDLGVLSFNGNKLITSGGGGMLLTASSQYAQRGRYLTTQAKDGGVEYLHKEVGYNYRLSNVQAALGLAQLEQLDRFVERKRAIAHAYEAAFRDVQGLTLMPTPPRTEPTYWLYTVLLREGTSLAERQGVVAQLRARGIEVRPLWHPIHALPPYKHCQAIEPEHALRLYARGISLPCSVGMTPDALDRCVGSIKQVLAR